MKSKHASACFLALAVFTLLLVAPQEAQAQCSNPYFIEQKFPTTGAEETRWRLCWRMVTGNGLIVSRAFFRKAPSAPWVEVLWEGRVSEIFVPYHSGSPRYYDVGFDFPWVKLTTKHCPSPTGTLLNGGDVCREVKDRGLAWNDDQDVRRGEELVLWGVIDAANYNYVIEWTFRDDGVVLGRVGATAVNLPSKPLEAHMHGVFWRLDTDINGFSGDSVHRVAHTESGLTATDPSQMILQESGLQWNPLNFHTLHIHDATLKNGQGHASGFHLMPIRTGTPRHQEAFTKNDFWVTRYNGSELHASELPTYVSTPASVSNTDVVVWYYGAVHHLVRDEDGHFVGNTWQGEAHVMWTGFMLKPHNLFDKTPLYP